MKKLLHPLLIIGLILFGYQQSNAQLVAGDIAIIGVNEDAGPVAGEDHSFTWIALKAIPAGEVIYFSEQGVNINSMTWFSNTEGHYSWTAPAGGLPCGTVVHVYENGAASETLIALGGGTMSAILSGSGWNLSSGDQVLVYQAAGARSAIGSTTFITGIHLNDDLADGESNGWTATTYNATGVAQCHLPPGLTDGVNCISLHSPLSPENDNNKYIGTLTGTSTVLRALINSPFPSGNWSGDNGATATVSISVGAYSPSVTCIAACTNPDVPTITATPSTICPGSSSTLSWTGALNDATAWHVYTTSCGVTQLTTTTSNSLVVTPGSSTTYFIRGEGGCVTAGSCGSATVTVQDLVNPTISCPGNQVGNVNGSCNFSLPDYTALATAADNCTASPTVTQVPAAGTIVGVGTTNIVLTATDGSSNTANCNFNVVVSDNTNPTISCPGNQVGSASASCQFTLPDYTGLATAADNCPGVTVTQLPAPGTNIGTGTTNIVLTATDGSSNTANCNFNVVVSDNTNPTISCPGNQVGSASASCQFTLPDYTGLATAADNCPGVTVTQSPVPGTTVGTGTTVITLTATDASINTANCNFNVVVSDNTNPTVTCPGNQTETPNASCQFTLPDYTGLATASDNCSASPTVTQSPAAGTVISGTTTITLTANDGNGNNANCTFDVILNDATAPTAVCQNINVFLNGAGSATIVAANIDGGSTDNCVGLTFSASQTTFTCADLGTNNVTLTVTDGNSNSSNCVAVVTVIDTISPVINCPGNQTETPNASCQFTLPDYTGLATTSDNCSASPTVTQSPVAGTVISGTTTITLTANDGNGNNANCTFDVILNDATAPTAVCQNINVFLNGAGSATIVAANIDGGSTDNCAGLTLSASQTTFTCADLGTNNVTLTVTDGNSNTATCVAVVTVIDNANPTISCPGNQTETPNASCQFTLPDYTGLATAADNCGSSTVTQLPVAGTVISGTTTITLTADDGNGNTANCTFDVILNLTACTGTECVNAIVLAPMILCGDTQNVTGTTVGGTPQTAGTCVTSAGTGGANWHTFTGDGGDWTVSTVSAGTNYDTKLWIFEGACGSLSCTTGNDDFSGVQSQVTFSTTVGLTYYIIVGGFNANEGNYDMTIYNAEKVAPVADLAILADVIAECNVTSLTAPTATDNCGTVIVTNNATLPINTQGTTLVTWTYDDGNGNTSTQTQNVVITDVTAPVADVATLTNVTGQCSVASVIAPTATDNCVGSVTGTTTASFPITSQGTTTITWTYVDGNGNSSTQTQDVVITDVTAPTISCPANIIACAGDTIVFSTPTGADNCSQTVTQTDATGLSNGMVFPVGITTIEFTSTDIGGNTAVCTFNVDVTSIDNTVTDASPTLTANQTGATYQWLDCNSGNTAIVGETNATFTATANGDYAVEVTLNGCVDTSACVNISTVGIDNINGLLSGVEIYPNPTTGNINLNFGQALNNGSVIISDITGKQVYSINNLNNQVLNLDINHFSKGIYFVKIQHNNQQKVIKLIKQ